MRFFKPGFRHCFVCVETEAGWAVIDPLSHCTRVGMAPPSVPSVLVAWFSERGMRAVVTRLRNAPRTRAPAAPYTCVEAVKRVLGLRARGVFTPWRLYQALVSEGGGRGGTPLGR